MTTAIVTGAAGLVGSEAVRFLHDQGMDVIGVDNYMREYFFGKEGSTRWQAEALKKSLKRYRHLEVDIRDQEAVFNIFQTANDISLVIHCAAQPSHDWAAKEPVTDFSVNAHGTMIVLEAFRRFAEDAVLIFVSTNKVYGDRPNSLPLVELDTRWELAESHPYSKDGIDESMSIDKTRHSVFGSSKVAADVMTQEYGRYFGLKTGIFRAGCLTGPAHSPAELHGFLSYLVKCAVTERRYTVYGYKGKQVRDNIHSRDLVAAFWQFYQHPRAGEVYNMGGSMHSNCSIIEAIQKIEAIAKCRVQYSITDDARSGDHIWWISNVNKFLNHYPEWKYTYSLDDIIEQMIEAARLRSGGTEV